MELISIEEAKLYLRLDGDVEDHNLEVMIECVREVARQYCKCALEKNPAIKQGMLIHLASIFESRGGEVSMPVAARALYEPYRKIML